MDGCAALVAGFAPPKPPNKLGALLVAVAVADAGGTELPPPRLGNSDGVDAVVVVAPGVVEAGLLEPNKLPAEAPALDIAPPNRPPVGAAEDVAPENKLLVGAAGGVAAALFPPNPPSPPRLKEDAEVAEGCEEAGCAADVAPMLNAGGLLAGVDEGVVLPRLPNSGGLGVAWVPGGTA